MHQHGFTVLTVIFQLTGVEVLLLWLDNERYVVR